MATRTAPRFSKWINNALAKLPGGDDALFQKLWREERLLFDGSSDISDKVDLTSARLVSAALRRRERLAIELPDFEPHRPAYLFATALIRHFLDSRLARDVTDKKRSGPILYFGATVGIRDQLRRINIRGLGLNLAEVFSQEDVSRGANGASVARSRKRGNAGGLPRVITVYAPADPAAVVLAFKPSWIAIDCADAASLVWLKPLLDEIGQLEISVIAWGQNPMSQCVAEFSPSGRVFSWPPFIDKHEISKKSKNESVENLLLSLSPVDISPLILTSDAINEFSALLQNATRALVRSGQHARGSFEKDALALHWRYYRALESLSVPIDFYESEAQKYWGLRSFSKIISACDHFRNMCSEGSANLYRALEEVSLYLSEAKQRLEQSGCGMWDGLINVCLAEPPNGAIRVLVFTTVSRCRIFLYALLARHNTTEQDLREMGTYVTSLTGLHKSIRKGATNTSASQEDRFLFLPDKTSWHPVLVGLPSIALTPRLLYTLLHPEIDILLYPHQRSSFMRRYTDWSSSLSGDFNASIGVLAHMNDMTLTCTLPSSPNRISVDKAVEMNVETTRTNTTSTTGPIWRPDDAIGEVARLFQSNDEENSEESLVSDQNIDINEDIEKVSEELWCESAIKIVFEHDWRAFFAPDDRINVIRKDALDESFVRSLKVGDRVVLIHGQQRQSLYDLIISRVHRHPSIELHLAMISRWQDEFRITFEQWSKHTPDTEEMVKYGMRDLSGLLLRIQALGSTLVSTLTITFWLRGLVLCPQDPEDLRRVAQVLEMEFVIQHYKRISQAATRLRGLHRGLSNRLNRWLKDQALGRSNYGEDDMIDVDLGLSFGDIQRSLLVLSVLQVENVKGPFLRSSLGRAEKV